MVRFDTYNASAHLVRQLEQSGRVEVLHDGGDNLLVQLESGERISIHLIETVLPAYEIRQVLTEHQAADIYTLFIVWGEMFLPEHGTVLVPDAWLRVLYSLYGDKVYAFGVYGKDIHIFPVYFDAHGYERQVRYGDDVRVADLGTGVTHLKTRYELHELYGSWRIADFNGQAAETARSQAGGQQRQHHTHTHHGHVHQKPSTHLRRRTPWEILGVPTDADREAVKQAYRRLARKYHPDVNPSHHATGQMQILNVAYDTILREIDTGKRKV